jgi:hypothetical protein
MKKHYSILLLLIVVFIATVASAEWTPITGLVSISSLNGGPLTFGDKKVSDIDLFGIGTGGAIAPTTDSVYIQGGQDTTTGNYGLRFVVSWAAFSGQTINADIHFDVSVLPGYDNYIKDVEMDITGVSATGTGGVAIGETVLSGPFPGGATIASLSCSKSPTDNGAFLNDSKVFAPVKEIWVWSKDVSITAGTNGSAHLSEFYQFYSQTQVPEPATIAMLTMGALALLKRKNSK